MNNSKYSRQPSRTDGESATQEKKFAGEDVNGRRADEVCDYFFRQRAGSHGNMGEELPFIPRLNHVNSYPYLRPEFSYDPVMHYRFRPYPMEPYGDYDNAQSSEAKTAPKYPSNGMVMNEFHSAANGFPRRPNHYFNRDMRYYPSTPADYHPGMREIHPEMMNPRHYLHADYDENVYPLGKKRRRKEFTGLMRNPQEDEIPPAYRYRANSQGHNRGRGKNRKTSKFRGVFWQTREKAWVSSIMVRGKKFHLGNFKDEIEAAKAYDKKALELRGTSAYLNFPSESQTQTPNKKEIRKSEAKETEIDSTTSEVKVQEVT